MSKDEKPAAVLTILQALYSDVFTISEYLEMLQINSKEEVVILQEGDAESFRSFLKELLVCIPWGAKKLPTPISYLQMSTQREVVARVIQRICEKKNKNVLAFGYGLVDKENSLRVMLAPTICSYFPNPTTTTVSTSALWETLLSRVGDHVMMHLLENCSLFMIVPLSCCYQISGLPVYNLASEDAVPPTWLKQRTMLYKNNLLFHSVHKHSRYSKVYFPKLKSLMKQTHGKVKATIPTGERTRQLKLGGVGGYQSHDTGTAATKPNGSKRVSDLDICNIPIKKCRMTLPPNNCHISEEKVKPAAGHSSQDMQHASLGFLSEKQNVIGQGRTPSVFAHSHPTDASIEIPTADSAVKYFDVRNISTSCFLASRTSEIALSKIFIDFGKLLYSRHVSKEGFLKNFLLNKLATTSNGGLILIKTIFMNNSLFEENSNLEVFFQSVKRRKVPDRYWKMRHVFQELIQNHKKCPYLALLKKCCHVRLKEIKVDKPRVWNKHKNPKHQYEQSNAIQTFKHLQNQRGNELQSVDIDDKRLKAMYIDDLDVLPLVKKHNTSWQVYTFSRECLNSLVPEILWGSSHNKCRFLKNVKKIIYSAKSKKMCLSELMWKMRVEDCLWLRLKKGHRFVPASEHLLREKILSKFLYWLMDTYVIQLLKSFYYITETMFQKNKLFYYRKYIWNKLQKIGIRKHFELVNLRLLSPVEIRSLQQQKNSPLVSTLRLIPKTNGLRPIAKTYSTIAVQQNREVQLKKEDFTKCIAHALIQQL